MCDVVRICADRRLLGHWGRSAPILPRPSPTWSRCRPSWRAAPSDSPAHGSASTTSPYLATPAHTHTQRRTRTTAHAQHAHERVEMIYTRHVFVASLAQTTAYALTYARVGLLANASLPAAMMWNRGGRLLNASTAGVQSGTPPRMRVVSCRARARFEFLTAHTCACSDARRPVAARSR